MKNLYHPLLLLIAGSTQKELASQIRYLKIENEILRSKLPKRVPVTEQGTEQAGQVRLEARQGARRAGDDRASRHAASLDSRGWLYHRVTDLPYGRAVLDFVSCT